MRHAGLGLGLGFICIALGLGCATGHGQQAQPPLASYIARDGTRLMLDGKPWRFLGYNDWYAASKIQASCTGHSPYSDTELDAELARFEATGAKVVRAWFFQSLALKMGRIDYSGFERLLSHAKAHHLRVIAVLANGQKDCEPGGKPKYLEWFSRQPAFPGSPLYQTVEPGYLLSYRQYAAEVAEHFANEPAIAWWELINEPHAIDDAPRYHCSETIPGGIGAAQALRAFVDDMAGVIKHIDHHHLVTIGAEAQDGACGLFGGARFAESYCATARLGCSSDFEYVHAGTIERDGREQPALDLIEIHEYGIYYCNNRTCDGDQYRQFLAKLTRVSGRIVAEARKLNKPMYFGELGLTSDRYVPPPKDQGSCRFADRYDTGACTSRADCLEKKLGAILAPSSGISGLLYWEATPSTKVRTGDCYAIPSDTQDEVHAIIARHGHGL